jgi:hypothetical protein
MVKLILRRRNILFLSLGVVSLSLLAFFAYTQTSMSFLPRDQIVERIPYTGPDLTLDDIPPQDCDQDLFFTKSQCETCLNILKPACPDCCLYGVGSPSPRGTHCTDDDPTGSYNCTQPTFDSVTSCPDIGGCLQKSTNCEDPSSCLISDITCDPPSPPGPPCCLTLNCSGTPVVSPYCHNQGCPPSPDANGNITPLNAATACREHQGKLYCNVDNLVPEDRGCVPSSGVQTAIGYLPAYHESTATVYFDIEKYGPSEPAPNDACPLPPGLARQIDVDPASDPCYLYTPQTAYASYITNCQNHANNWEECEGRKICCGESWTCPDGNYCEAGLMPNCDTCDLNAGCACDLRIQWPWCDSATITDCLGAQNSLQECFLHAGTGCRSCFKDVSPSFQYEFVARNREEMVVIWQVTASLIWQSPPLPAFPGNFIRTYFYTLVKVIEKDDPDRIPAPHESIVNQKAFNGDFTVYGATFIPQDVLTPGKTYIVKLYYFIPVITGYPWSPGAQLNMRVRDMQLINMRIRE